MIRIFAFKTFRNFLKGFALSLLAVTVALAQDINVEVELSAKKISLNSSAQMAITVSGSQDVETIQLPAVEGLDVKYLGPSTRVSVVNGRYSSSKTFTYALYPRKVGQFKIPAFDVLISGKVYRIDEIVIEVVDSGPAAQGAQGPVSIEDKIFMKLEVPKNEIYLNERVPIKVLLFITGLNVDGVQFPEIDSVGFSIADYPKPKQYQTIIEGIRFNVVEFNTYIYATREGQLTLGPATTTCGIVVARSGAPGGRGSVFDDAFFSGFFGRQEKRPLSVSSDEVVINVLPFPEEGKPDDFSGAVGDFSFNVAVSPKEVREGDPITLRTTIIGNGNLTGIQMPTLPMGSPFKIYDPQILEKDDIKKTEQVIIPESEQVTEVPAIRFSYFDPESRKYQTIAKGPFPIKVQKLEEGDEFKVVGLEGAIRTVKPEMLGEDIVFIKNKPGHFQEIGNKVYENVSFYIFVGLFVMLWFAGFLYYRHSCRIRTDSVYARRLQAPRQARQGLAHAKKLIASDKKEEFYDSVFKTVQQYLGNKLHLSSGAVSFETVKEPLDKKGIDQDIINDVKKTYDECDMIRYASADVTKEKMNASYQRLAKLIDHLERFLK